MIKDKKLVRSYITPREVPNVYDETLKDPSSERLSLSRMPRINKKSLDDLEKLTGEWIDEHVTEGYMSYFVNLQNSKTSIEEIFSNPLYKLPYGNATIYPLLFDAVGDKTREVDLETAVIDKVSGLYGTEIEHASTFLDPTEFLDLLIDVSIELHSIVGNLYNKSAYDDYILNHTGFEYTVEKLYNDAVYVKSHPEDVSASDNFAKYAYDKLQGLMVSTVSQPEIDSFIKIVDDREIRLTPTTIIPINDDGYYDGCLIVFDIVSVNPNLKALRFTNVGEETASFLFTDDNNVGTSLRCRFNGVGEFEHMDLSTYYSLIPSEYVEIVGDNSELDSFIGHFEMEGTIKASGSVMSLIWGETITDEQKTYLPFNAFDGDDLGLFSGCTGLVSAPELPATQLPDYCYFCMFSGCNSLTEAPKLPATILTEGCYSYMFSGCTSLTAAPELPATELTTGCYEGMFSGCTSLTAAPELPATKLADYCYNGMFDECTSLTAVPELPATELATSCYQGMFSGCTSLVAAPELPATKLATSCYQGMFSGCTSLVAAPELPATEIAEYCYRSMFQDCTSLNYVNCSAVTNVSEQNCNNWLLNVSETGTFVKDPNTEYTTGENGIPEGWEIEYNGKYDWRNLKIEALTSDAITIQFSWGSKVPVLDYSYDNNNWNTVSGSTQLTIQKGGAHECIYLRGINRNGLSNDSNPSRIFIRNGRAKLSGNILSLVDYRDIIVSLPQECFAHFFRYATTDDPDNSIYDISDLTFNTPTAGNMCYLSMFQYCTNLKYGPRILPAKTVVYRCYDCMFNCCSSLETAPKLPATTLANQCYQTMFNRCYALTKAPELPATTLASYCYYQMFRYCTALEKAPYLPALSLTTSCYQKMFENSSSLNYIKCNAVNGVTSGQCSNWCSGVSATGTFVKNPNAYWDRNVNGIPTGWTVEDIQ